VEGGNGWASTGRYCFVDRKVVELGGFKGNPKVIFDGGASGIHGTMNYINPFSFVVHYAKILSYGNLKLLHR
jgi:hypothetical protein